MQDHHRSGSAAHCSDRPCGKRRGADLLDGLKQGVLIGAAIVALAWPLAPFEARAPLSPAPAQAAPRQADFAGERVSSEVRHLASWVLASADHRQGHFAIIDKKAARVFVFEPSGRLRGAAPVLIGAAVGDDSVSGIGERPLAQIQPHERTTPAGRFVAEPGRNLSGEEVVWVDYDAAVSMHRVRTTVAKERRLERLASPNPQEHRISYGCINLPAAFFDAVVHPAFYQRRGVVYVLPEVKPFSQVFPAASQLVAGK